LCGRRVWAFPLYSNRNLSYKCVRLRRVTNSRASNHWRDHNKRTNKKVVRFQ
jgi:hypothetical protein